MRIVPLLVIALLIPSAAFAQGYYQPQPGYGPAPVYTPPPGNPHRNGFTFEANLGIGWAQAADDDGGEAVTSDAVLGGLNLGFGGWLNQTMALSFRIAGVSDSQNGVTAVAVFAGPSLQYWVNDNLWLGGGAGLARVAVVSSENDVNAGINGFGLDLRGGYTFSSSSPNTFNVSLELTPGFYDGGSITGIAILAGYQHL
ncbi:MAG: hypothetical protein AB7O24_27280 [Kofleriaceae bacterium]